MTYMDKLVEKYLTTKTEQELFPNWEDFCVFYFNELKKFPNGEYKGNNKPIIDTFSKQYLNNVIGMGGRNSLTYLQLLKQLNEESADITNPITLRFDLTGGKNRLKVKDGK